MQGTPIRRARTATLEIGYEEHGNPAAHLLSRGYSREVIPDAGHFAHGEQPAMVSDAVSPFLRQAG